MDDAPGKRPRRLREPLRSAVAVNVIAAAVQDKAEEVLFDRQADLYPGFRRRDAAIPFRPLLQGFAGDADPLRTAVRRGLAQKIADRPVGKPGLEIHEVMAARIRQHFFFREEAAAAHLFRQFFIRRSGVFRRRAPRDQQYGKADQKDAGKERKPEYAPFFPHLSIPP